MSIWGWFREKVLFIPVIPVLPREGIRSEESYKIGFKEGKREGIQTRKRRKRLEKQRRHEDGLALLSAKITDPFDF